MEEVSAGNHHTCARSREGAVYCWGLNHFAQLGDGSRASRLVPVLSHGIAGVAALDVAYDHSCVETESGSRLCWGLDVYGEAAGDGRAGIGQTAEPVASVRDAVQVVASLIHTCSLDAQGAVNCWGRNYYGTLGALSLGVGEPRSVVGLERRVTRLAAGGYHTCAKDEAGGVSCWGLNNNSQFGDGTLTSRDRAVSVPALTPLRAMGFGRD